MSLESYYRDHWLEIEPERLERYDALFQLPPERAEKLLAPLALRPGEAALDFGCGPGYVAAEIARLTAPDGRVHAVDVNADFVKRAREVADGAGVGDRVEVHHATGERLPLSDACCDVAYAKNVLEYVPDLGDTLGELRRVLRPGGRLVASDSDWGFVVAEPFTPEEVRELFAAARPAFREPYVGRKLRGAFRAAGFADVRVEVAAVSDTKGFLRTVLDNMIGYGRSFDTLPAERAKSFAKRLDDALASGDYLMVLPQFRVTGTRPS